MIDIRELNTEYTKINKVNKKFEEIKEKINAMLRL